MRIRESRRSSARHAGSCGAFNMTAENALRAIRMKRRFDHYLKGEPAADWITKGSRLCRQVKSGNRLQTRV